MKNQNTKLVAHGAEIQVTPAGSVYVTIKGRTVYFENDVCGIDISTWSQHDEPDTSIDLWNMKAEETEYEAKIKALEKKNFDLEMKLADALEIQRTCIYWSPEDVYWFMVEGGPKPDKYKGIKLSVDQCRLILEKAIALQSPEEGLTWDILEGYIDCYLLKIGPFCKK